MRRFWESEFDGSDENLAYWTKKISNIATIGVGSVDLMNLSHKAKELSLI